MSDTAFEPNYSGRAMSCIYQELSSIRPSSGIPSRKSMHHPHRNFAFRQSIHSKESYDLLEDLAVGEFILFAVDRDGLVPCPLVVDELLVLSLLGVELGELVALVVGGDIESREGLLSTDDEGTLDDGIVALSVDGRGTKDVLAAGLETSKESTCNVVS